MLLLTILVVSLLLVLVLALVSIIRMEIRTTEQTMARYEAQANARLALQMAVAQLQTYAGPDQRVTARADITDEDWQALQSDLHNPYYTYVWDVSGSELDLSPSTFDFAVSRDVHRPGMDAGHDFSKVPAVLVSGNERFRLTGSQGRITANSYPPGYTTGETDPSAPGTTFITLVPRQRMLISDADQTAPIPSVRVPLVDIATGGRMAWWVGDESVKNRIDIGNVHPDDSLPARMLAQRAPPDPLRTGLDGARREHSEAQKLVSVRSAMLSFGSTLGDQWSYSPDITVDSDSLLTDVRSGGLKQDLTYALYNPGTAGGMPEELKDNEPVLDLINGGVWGNNTGGLDPKINVMRTFAMSSGGDPNLPISIGTGNVSPVISQVQVGLHAAYRRTGGSTFKVYFSVFPSVTLWNPYNVPMRLDKDIIVELNRRSGTLFWWLDLFKANYAFKNSDGTTVYTNDGVFDTGGRGGWNFRMEMDADGAVVIPPGKAMVFSPEENTLEDSPVAPNPSESFQRTTFPIKVKPGWRPGKGLIFALDDLEHDAAAFGGTVLTFPKISFGLGGLADNNLVWSARYADGADWRLFSYWSRLNSKIGGDSPFFDPPLTTDTNQDTSGDFPGLLIKYALRMGEDYLNLPPTAIHPDQSTLLFPYMASHNPMAVFHAGTADSYASNPNSNATKFWSAEGTGISPTLMGAAYDYQAARTIYPVPTVDALETYSYIGNGYLGPSEKMVIAELAPGIPSSYPNAASASLVSLTQLNHSSLTDGFRTGNAGHWRYTWMGTSNYPAYPVGNSLGDFRLNVLHQPHTLSGLDYRGSLARYDTQGWRAISTHYDVSYLLNDRFYDRYFFSTVPQQGVYDPDSPLIQSRLIPQVEDIDELRGIDSAENLILRGGFNINSTSVAAWEMLLSSSLGVAYPGGDTSDGEVVFANRTDTAAAVEVSALDELDAAAGDKAGILTPDQIRVLAEHIVRQVKRRGPFPTLSSFINRVNRVDDVLRDNPNDALPSTLQDVRYSGSLQAALDASGFLANLYSGKRINPTDYVRDPRFYPATGALRKSANSHLPGALKQSDILRQIDPVITARGDTFVIRTVGISTNEQGDTLAIVACEAVVQRSVDYIDSTERGTKNPYTVTVNTDGTRTFDPALSSVNQTFGRKFHITKLQWLPPREVELMVVE